MHHDGLVVRKKTHTAQKKKSVAKEMDDFLDHFHWKCDVLGINNEDAIVNADKTDVCFSPHFKRTIAEKRSKTVSIAEANHNSHCAAMIGAAESGRKLPPFVIFVGKPTGNGKILKECLEPAQRGHAEDVVCVVQESGWMDEVTMLDWIEWVWKPCSVTIDGMKLPLIDNCTAHVTSGVQCSITSTRTELEIVPPGCISKPQPMDTGLNEPFKDFLCHEVEQFLTVNPMGARPTCSVVLHWISCSWADIPVQMILNTWHHIGHFTKEVIPHPDPFVEEENNENDLLAKHKGNPQHRQEDKYDSYGSLELLDF